MTDLDTLLGIDPDDPEQQLADELTRADYVWVDQLKAMRKHLGMSQEQVARRMGVTSQSVVSDIENLNGDPRLSTLRRYALAIGAAVSHRAYLPNGGRPTIKASLPSSLRFPSADEPELDGPGDPTAVVARSGYLAGIGH